jgi:hypothetical protein
MSLNYKLKYRVELFSSLETQTTVIIDGFHLTFGDASGLGGHDSSDAGGNVYIDKASVNFSTAR